MPDSTASRMFSHWRGPGTIAVDIRSPYTVELDGTRRHFHANELRRFHVRVDSVITDNLIEDLTCGISTCAIIREGDEDFGVINTVPNQIDQQKLVEMPSSKIDYAAIAHLTEEQQRELLEVLDRYPACFSETPGFTSYVIEHEIEISPDFRPKRLRSYRVPERLKPEVDRQIQEMLKSGIIRPSKSPMSSPLVCILKGRGGQDGVRLAVDYRFLNRYTASDALPLRDIASVFERIGQSRFITVRDCKAGYWQIAFGNLINGLLPLYAIRDYMSSIEPHLA